VAGERYFTVAEANALLSEIEPILERIAELYVELSSLFGELASQGFPAREEEGRPDDPVHVREKRAQLRELARELQEQINEVNGLGCVLKDVESGLVDFPSRRGGQIVNLCWKRGEPETGWWHDLESGFAGRRPIHPDDEFEGTYLH
jgi:hypothetical protein